MEYASKLMMTNIIAEKTTNLCFRVIFVLFFTSSTDSLIPLVERGAIEVLSMFSLGYVGTSGGRDSSIAFDFLP
jgi:hypothetical protein